MMIARRALQAQRHWSLRCALSTSAAVDLRSDTVTQPSRKMLEAALTAPTGDDVFGEDPTVLELQSFAADLFGKEAGLFVPTGTMGNLAALLSHCHGRASEIIIGANSHICIYEGGNAANLGGISTRQIVEESGATLPEQAIRDCYRLDDDDHYAKTEVLCLENTHNVMGGVALPKHYLDAMGDLCHNELNIKLHVDGARICNAAVSLNLSPEVLCEKVDSVSICLSKGLGAPLGTVLVGETEFIRKAKRARKRLGGGMRQAGVVAAMGLYAIQNNFQRLEVDHRRARRLAGELKRSGFILPRNGQVDTNIVYFGLPENSLVPKEDLCAQLNAKYGIKLTGGYSRGGELFRMATHLDVDDEGVDRAAEALTRLVLGD